MTPKRRLMIGAIVLMTGAAGYVTGRTVFRPVQRVVQPITFNHQLHAQELELECLTCHEFYESGRHAGLPSLEICGMCHSEKDPEMPEADVVVEMAASGETDVFLKLFKLADHAFYSHRRHVVLAGLECETCHGDIAASTAPPETPLIRITMDLCLDCHEREGVNNDCTSCHH